MTRRMHIGALEVYGPQVGGTLSWPHRLSEQINFADTEHWIEVARILEDGGFDFLFFADGYGYPMIGEEISAVAVEHGINFYGYDPTMIIPVLAQHTTRLGFVVTASTGMDHPVQLARRFSTLDQLTGGRIGWNIVTGASQNAVAQVLGHAEMLPHATRYAMAAEYVELAVMFWEQGWDDDALVADKHTGQYLRREGFHRVDYSGEHYRSAGYFTAPPTPQRTPVLFQAGTSPKGRAFAAAHAECVFVQATTPAHTAVNIADIRARAAEAGRDPDAITIMAGLTVFVAPEESAAAQLEAEFLAMQTDEIAATLYAGNTGIDLLALDPEGTLHQVFDGDAGLAGQMGVSNIERFLGGDGVPAPTVREILDDLRGRGTRGFTVVGTGEQVADQLQGLVEETDLDGFLIEPVYDPHDLRAFSELVMPVLRQRGLLPAPIEDATLRERIRQHPGARLGTDHPVLRKRPAVQPTEV